MRNIFEENGFSLLDSGHKDLEVYRKEDVLLVTLMKFKGDKKAFRQASNHLDSGLISELSDVFNTLAGDKDIFSVILTSSHKVAFSRGAKIEVLMGATTEQSRLFIEEAQKILLQIQRFTKPVIAAINGLTFGGGLELAMACDYRLSSDRENVVFGQPEALLGIIPGMGGTQNLPRLVGMEKAREIIMNARADINAQEAKECGLVDKIVPSEKLIEEAFLFAANRDLKKGFSIDLDKITVSESSIRDEIKNYMETLKIDIAQDQKVAPLAKALLSFLFEKTKDCTYLDGLRYEKEVFCRLQQTADCKEGIKALGEERPPVFQGK
ncbi:MAG: enoyl-CoA hydratase/isomerase family protein [Candidatus Omnitrophica bacterium]|nr:enoyl-CoA hydratase/isomerase family protein [Candidatus Omnitrophota bacterium]